MAINYFHFSLGPVQSFIAQARRTRDFWAGSFILSWLSAVAMQAVIEQKGTIEFPKPDDDYLLWLKGEGKKTAPQQGGVPNRFKASVNDDFKPGQVVEAVNQAWQALAATIYQGDLVSAKAETKEIWDRQVAAFWDISWVITDDQADSSALDVRKNWRSHLPPKEPGVKCMMMDGWQELSGVDKPNAEALEKFWQDIRENGNKGIKTDLRKNERLCAIGFIKRRFVRYFHLVPDTKLNGWTLSLKNWQVDVGRPSVAYMAAVRWLEKVLIEAKISPDIAAQLWRFHDVAYDLTDGKHNEWDNQIECINSLKMPRKWSTLDGNVFFETTLENANIYDDQVQAQKVLNELKTLQNLVKTSIASQAKPDLQPATPFYAVLMMDGDSLGKQMSDSAKQKTITDGLKNFTDSVPDLVQKNNGFLIYAGGDDVLAVLPLEDALPCALAIREKYGCVFADLNEQKAESERVSTSISAAIEFTHIKMPLMKVLKDAHGLLDNVAKDKYGRDSLAVRVWKPGGMVLEWGMPWEKAITDDRRQLILERLAKNFADDDQDYGKLSSKFLYKIRERFVLLNPDKKGEAALNEEQAIELMAAEYFSSGLCDPYPAVDKMQHARAVVKPLLKQCRPVYRDADKPDNPELWTNDTKIFVDAALLVRFLAQKGISL